MARQALTVVILVALVRISLAESSENQATAFVSLGSTTAVHDAEFRLGPRLRRFTLIDNQWEFDRSARLIHGLPKVDLEKECLLLILSSPNAPTKLEGLNVDGETLVLAFSQAPVVQSENREYRRPNFDLYKFPLWSGPVRFEVNHEPQFTVLRGEVLEKRCAELWEEILRLHSGGRPNRSELIQLYRVQWPAASDKEIVDYLMKNKDKVQRIKPQVAYDKAFEELVNIGAKPLIPRLFALIDSMGKFDPAFTPACSAIIGIGGPEVVDYCKVAIKSQNPRSRDVGMSILTYLELPDTRAIAYEHLGDIDANFGHNSFDLLNRLGITKSDVPAMIEALNKIDDFYQGREDAQKPVDGYYDGEVAKSIMWAFGQLHANASEALPLLERMAAEGRIPALQEEAQQAIAQIKADAEGNAKANAPNSAD
jgi:uncharacterized small protein (DUF1192 family)